MMYLWTSFLLISLLATAQGWQMLIIDEANQQCSPKPSTRARLLMGSGKECLALNGNLGNTECVHYVWSDPEGQYIEQTGGCKPEGFFFPQSARYFDLSNTGAVCEFFDSFDCSYNKIRPYEGDHKVCAAEAVFGGAGGVSNSEGMRIHSFKCAPKKE